MWYNLPQKLCGDIINKSIQGDFYFMKTKRKIQIILLAGCMLVGISGCELKQAQKREETDFAQIENEKIELNVNVWQDEKETIQLLASKYMERNTDIIIHVNAIPISQYSQKIMGIKNKADMVDCVFSPNTSEAFVWMKKGILENIDQYVKDTEMVSGYDEWYNDGEEECVSYMLPYRTSRWAVYYNKKLFDQKEVPYPFDDWTWEDYAEIAQKLTGYSDRRKIYGSLSFAPDNIWWRVPARTAGAENPLSQNDLDEFKIAAQWCYDLTYDLHAQIPYTENAGDSGTNYEAEFLEGNTGMYFSGDWSAKTLNQEIQRQGLDFEYDIAELPHWDDKEAFQISDAAVVSMVNGTKYPDETFDFMKFVAGEEGAEILAENSILPAWNTAEVRQKYKDSYTMPEHIEKFFSDKKITRTLASAKYVEAMETVKEQMALCFKQNQTVDQTFFNIEKELKSME